MRVGVAQVPNFIASGNEAYFVCTNKGCDPSQVCGLHALPLLPLPSLGAPVAQAIGLKLGSPTTVPTSFQASLPIVLPKATVNGQYHGARPAGLAAVCDPGCVPRGHDVHPPVVVWGEDQTHTYDFTATVVMALECNSDADCPPTSYCVNYKVRPRAHDGCAAHVVVLATPPRAAARTQPKPWSCH